MSVPAYQDYKDTGVQWLGAIPSAWTTIPFGALFRRTKRVGFPDDELLSVYRDYGVIRKSDRDDNFNNASEDLSTYQLVEPGDLAMNKMKAWQGSLGISPHRGIVSPAYFVFAPRQQFHPQFLHYLLRSPPYAAGYMTISKGIRINQWDVDPDHLSSMPVVLPSVDEQAAITAFLDRETAKIDALVAEQERLIALLKEKRQAVISHAVTKGLNPNAPMKDSGIEWLGEIPAHWEVSKLKFASAFITSGSRGWGEYYADEGPLFIRIGNLTRDSIALDLRDEQRVSIPENAEGARSRLRPGDLLFSITAYLGSVAVVPDDIEEAYISQHVALCRLSADAPEPSWLGYVAASILGRTHFDLRGYGGTKIQLSLDDVAMMPITVPPTDEQRAIMIELENRLASFQKMEAEAQSAITLLQERRAALISAAVTGKIDVRGLANQMEIEAA